MKFRLSVTFLVLIAIVAPASPSYGLSAPQVAEDRDSGYNRNFFKHWVDADRNGCDTRAEVLISEAVVKPKVDKKCKISGGKWLSKYDNKSVTNASQLDVDHLVPLAEAWRSGAWAWTPQQRQDFANDLSDKRALIAVTLSTNRSKGDKDISDWVPKVDTCGYVQNWIAIKTRYSLTYDPKEARWLVAYFEICKIGNIPVQVLSGYSYQSAPVQPAPTPTTSSTPVPTPSASQSPIPVASPTPTVAATPTPTPTPTVTTSVTPTPTPSATQETNIPTISPGAFCSPAGATGKSANGTLYTCKTSATDTRNRWRQ